MTKNNDEKTPKMHALRDKISGDPVGSAHEFQQMLVSIDIKYKKGFCALLELAFMLALHLVADKGAWELYCEDEFWQTCSQKRPKLDDNPEAKFLWVMRHLFQASKTKGPAYLRAYKHYRTLYGYYRDEVPADEVAKKLEKKGTEYAFSREIEENPRQSTEKRPKDRAKAAIMKNDGAKSSDREIATSEQESDDELLKVEVDEEELDSILDLPVGGRAKITVTRMEDDDDSEDGWKRIVATSVKILED